MTPGRVAVIAFLAVIVLCACLLLLARPAPPETSAVEEGKQVVALIHVTNPGLTKLHAVASAYARTAHLVADTGAAKAAAAKTIDQALATAKTARDSVPILLQEVEAFRVSTDIYRRAYFTMATAYQAASLRGDSLAHMLALARPALSGLIAVADCRIFRLGPLAPRCIPRRTSFALGVLAMLGVGLALHVHL